MSEADALDEDCIECSEDDAAQCPRSVKPCGHHCNHVWTHDACCYCGWLVPNDDDPGGVREPPLPPSRPRGGLAALADPPEAPQRPEKRLRDVIT